MIRVLLVDDQNLVREGLKSLLNAQADIDVIAEAENGQMAIDQVKTHQPDVVLMDVRMPKMDGVVATQILSQDFPGVKVMILSTFDDDDFVADAMQSGAKGYLLKDTPSAELAEAIRSIHRGYTQLGPGLFEKAMHPKTAVAPSETLSPIFQMLTPREREVLTLIAEGKSNREIAQALYITERTVKNHVNSILRSLDVRDRTQAAILVKQSM